MAVKPGKGWGRQVHGSRDLVNQVYNGNFQWAQGTEPNFPDGWLRVGGDAATTWEWVGAPPGPGSVAIVHPSGPPAGILQEQEVAVPAGEMQRWKVEVRLQADPPGTACYLRVYMGTAAGYLTAQIEFGLAPGTEPEVLTRVFTTATGTTCFWLEAGIIGPGRLMVQEIKAYRLYPVRALRSDEKGRVFVRHVDTVGEILKPVRLAGPLPVTVQATVAADIRDLTPLRDGVRVYGSSNLPVATTPEGLPQVEVAQRAYSEAKEEVVATPTWAYTAARDVSALRLFSYAAVNVGTAAALVRMEISPDGSYWADDTPAQAVPAQKLLVCAPRFFLRYARLAYQATVSTPLVIWFQAQA